MSEWKEYKLGDVLNLKRGYDLPSQNRSYGSIPIFSSSGITDYHNTAMKDGPGVITGRYGTIGKVFYTENPYWPLNTTLYVQDFKGNYPKFIFYFLQGLDLEKYSDKSAVPGINRNELHKEFVKLPPLLEQQAISSILSNLDDKIDLLHHQNKTIEQLAETLFRQWFIEEAEEKWQSKPLKEVCEIINGFAFKSIDYRIEGKIIIRTMNFKNGFIDLSDVVFISLEDALNYQKYHLKRFDFLLVMVGASIGKFVIVTSDVLPALQNQNMWNFRTFGKLPQHYLNFAIRTIIIENLNSASGSAREFFQKGQFYKLHLPIPEQNKLNTFNSIVEEY